MLEYYLWRLFYYLLLLTLEKWLRTWKLFFQMHQVHRMYITVHHNMIQNYLTKIKINFSFYLTLNMSLFLIAGLVWKKRPKLNMQLGHSGHCKDLSPPRGSRVIPAFWVVLAHFQASKNFLNKLCSPSYDYIWSINFM